MKPNVDLTENRIFTTPKEPSGVVKELLNLLEPKPWDFENMPTLISDDLDLQNNSYKNEELVFTGNKEERQIKKMNRLYDTGKYCYICGRACREKPWTGITCNCYSMEYRPKFPWNPRSF